jgi:hypothetical protein
VPPRASVLPGVMVPSTQLPTSAKGLSKCAVKYSVYRSCRLLGLCGPQKSPAVIEPVTVCLIGSMWTVESVLPSATSG